MKIGPAVRQMMPPVLERKVSGIYRSVFVDLSKVADCLARHLPASAALLDIGGGDGELLNRLLALRPDIRISMVDVAASVGRFLETRHADSVEFHPATSIEQHLVGNSGAYNAVLASDVMHHLPPSYRPVFLRALFASLAPGGSIFVKDVEPGYFIASLGLYFDKYISGDRGVVLISQAGLKGMAAQVLPAHSAEETGLFDLDRPNYLLRLDFPDAVATPGVTA